MQIWHFAHKFNINKLLQQYNSCLKKIQIAYGRLVVVLDFDNLIWLENTGVYTFRYKQILGDLLALAEVCALRRVF